MKAKIADSKCLNLLGNTDLFSKRVIAAALAKLSRRHLGYVSLFAGAASVFPGQPQEVWAREVNENDLPPRIAKKAKTVTELNANCAKPELLRRQSNYLLPHQKGKYNIVAEFANGGDSCPGTAIPSGTYTAAVPFVDTGDTTGANNTITAAESCFFYSSTYQSLAGADLMYSFTLRARGASPQIRMTRGSSATYNPAIYLLNGTTGQMCPAGPGASVSNCLQGATPFDTGGAGPEATIRGTQINELPLNVPLYLFVDSYFNAAGAGGPYTLRIQDVTIGPAVTDAPVDLNADGKTDFTVIRNTGGGQSGQATWFTKLNSGNPTSSVDWGIASDQFVPADYDLDGRDDLAVFRPGSQGRFYIIQSQTSTLRVDDFGQTGDNAVVADYNGDHRDDIAVYRGGATPGAPSFWFYKIQGDEYFVQVPMGQNGDVPAPGDYDGDGKSDFVIQRTAPNGVDGRFHRRLATGTQDLQDFGKALDKIVPGDYDGDGKTDFAAVRAGADGIFVWEFEPSGTAGITVVRGFWGLAATDIITPGDYDGDGTTDFSVWRPGSPGTFYMMTAGTRNITATSWGAAGDYPVANHNVR